MSPETRAFLDGVRHAEDPTHKDEARVLSAVNATLAAATAVGAGIAASKATKLLAASFSSGLKLAGALVGLAASVWVLGSMLSAGPYSASTLDAARSGPVSPWSEPGAAVKLLAPPASPAPAATPLVAPPRVATEPRAPAPVASSAGSVRSVRSAGPASLREEIALLAEVHTALARGNGAGALGRLDGHTTADRQLLAERRALRILALCSLGRSEEARNDAAEFLRHHPLSVQRTLVERSCAGSPSERR